MSHVVTDLCPGVCVFKPYAEAHEALLINKGVKLPLAEIYKLYEKYVKDKNEFTSASCSTKNR